MFPGAMRLSALAGALENSIRNCLTVFQHDQLFRGALRLNLLTEQIDIVKPLGWERTSTTLTDMDMNYLLLYLEENYGLTSEKRVQSTIKIVANENRYHPVRGFCLECLEYIKSR